MQLVKFSVAAFCWAQLHYPVPIRVQYVYLKITFEHPTFCQLKLFKKRFSVLNIVCLRICIVHFSYTLDIGQSHSNSQVLFYCIKYMFFGHESLLLSNKFWYANAIKTVCIVFSSEFSRVLTIGLFYVSIITLPNIRSIHIDFKNRIKTTWHKLSIIK